MKLDNYFSQQKWISLSEGEKFNIYQKILTKKTQKSFFRKKSLLHAKSFIYGFAITILFVGIYGTYLSKTKINIDQGNLIITPHPLKGVEAGYTANIVNFKWNFTVLHEGIELQTNIIHNGDTVELKDQNTEVIFHLNDGTQGTVKGYAKFTIYETKKDEYKLYLQTGKFLELQSLQKKNNQDIKLVTNDIIIHTQKSNEPTNFQFIKQNGQQIVKNKGAQLSVKKNNEDTKVNKEQLLAIQKNNIQLRSMEEFEKAVENHNITQTFKLTNNNKNKEQPKKLLALQFTSLNYTGIVNNEITNLNTGIIAKLSGLFMDEKIILSNTQSTKLRGLLQAELLNNNTKDMFIYFVVGNEKAYKMSYNKLENRIAQLYETFGQKYITSNNDVTQLKENIFTLIDILTNQYHTPPKHTDNLYTIIQQLDTIHTYEFNSFSDENTEAERTTFQNSTSKFY